ncbi:helix-turn-helix domain-containing protein [Ketogulonicigenium vulgare]|uniref:Helix-turn-helix domain-containing protein n=1 Tax=Ketogulonicigenium vulgare (strain WSH-001) TaxID=759362 RepID=F9YA13_KETVW|nr:helix-turn-helix domain-containing protein [Ketogulonicigenium vulgare]AEM41424.1 hypothetical protein KVU_1585 [Ketogulonicigenium vulgare WSH-001]ALJ81558.1 hypothetical protein KVH_10455 [Ketogulonicigenium vulgare]ANW34253.1 hypothetical protein KvSKV_10395 [Ketogulonicigenium vulgare]
MSHKANYWLASLDPNRVKAGAFRVLFHLCDHHNDETDPALACYPSQARLMEKTGLSNGALNSALATMEEDGLIIRRKSTAPGSKERRTYYILGCDFAPRAEQTPFSGVSANSGPQEPVAEQTPDLGASNSSFEPIKLRPTGEEPVRTGKNRSGAGARATRDGTDLDLGDDQGLDVGQGDQITAGFWADLLQALNIDPMKLPARWAGKQARADVAAWLGMGFSPDQVIEVAKASRQQMPQAPNGPKALDARMAAAASAKPAGGRASMDEMAAFWASKITAPGYIAPSAISPALARHMLQREMIAPDQLRARGISF